MLDAIFYLLRTGCQWRLLPRNFPPWSTVRQYFRTWKNTGTWVRLHRTLYAQARLAAGRKPCPSLVIMDGQSVKTTERGGVRGFDGHKLIKDRKRHILVDTLGLTWIVECCFAWLGRNRRLSKDDEYQVQSSETLIDVAAIRLMFIRLAPT